MSNNAAPSRAVPTRAQYATNAIAHEGAWTLDILGLPVDPRFSHHIYVPTAELVILPTGKRPADMTFVMNPVMAHVRSDALIVFVTRQQPWKLELAVGIWHSTETRWFLPMALWRGEAGLWIVPDPYHRAVRAECFHVNNGRLRPTAAPWTSKADEVAGRSRADAWMAPFIA